MKLKRLFVENGSGHSEYYRLTDGLNILEATDVDAVDDILRSTFGLAPRASCDILAYCVGLATVEADEPYTVDIRFFRWWAEDNPDLVVRDADGGVCTEEYLSLLHGAAGKICDICPHIPLDLPPTERLLQQRMEDDRFVCFDEFRKEPLPHRLPTVRWRQDPAATRRFEDFKSRFIRSFVPVRLRDDKPYVLRLTADGRCIVTFEDADNVLSLSETETMLYHLRCFFLLSSFWDKLKAAWHMEYDQKPILIRGLFECMDSLVDVLPLLDMMRQVPRQILLLTPKITGTRRR